MKANARRNWTLVALAGVFGLAGILVAGGGNGSSDLPSTIQRDDSRRQPPEERVSRALFGALHDRTVDTFSMSIGFGYDRMGTSADHIGMDQLWTILPPDSAGYEVVLIGLESEPQGTVYSVEKVEPPLPGVVNVAQGKNVDQMLASTGTDIVVNELLRALREVEKNPTSELDREMLALLEKSGEAPMLVDGNGEQVMIYGGIRATQQRCITCHKCEPDTLLGAFRYVFELPAENGSEVAGR